MMESICAGQCMLAPSCTEKLLRQVPIIDHSGLRVIWPQRIQPLKSSPRFCHPAGVSGGSPGLAGDSGLPRLGCWEIDRGLGRRLVGSADSISVPSRDAFRRDIDKSWATDFSLAWCHYARDWQDLATKIIYRWCLDGRLQADFLSITA